MLNRIVPTPVTEFGAPAAAGGLALALIRKTSVSGRLKGTELDQLRLISSTHCVPLKRTIRPVLGASGVAPGGKGGRPPPWLTTASSSEVVRLPVWNPAA